MTLNEFKAQHNITIDVKFDSQIYRFGENNRYWIIGFDNREHGLGLRFGDWKASTTIDWFEKNLSEPEKKQYLNLINERKQEIDKIKKEKQELASKKAEQIWLQTTENVQGFPYLIKKKIENLYGARFTYNHNLKEYLLVIPLKNIKGELTSLQYIDKDGNKKFLSGGKVKGSFFTIGSGLPSGPIIVTEGYATAVTLHEATGHHVICAFNASNIFNVCNEIKSKYKNVIVCADADEFNINENTGEPFRTGQVVAEKIKKEIGIEYILPKFKDITTKPTDFNDLMILEGLEEVRKQIEEFENEPAASPETAIAFKEVGIETTKSGTPIYNETNIVKLFEYKRKDYEFLRFDTFLRRIMVKLPDMQEFEQIQEKHVLSVLIELQKYGFKKLSLSMCRNAMEHFAYQNQRNELQEYLNSIKWDQINRLEDFFVDYCGAEKNEYTKRVGVNFFVSLVARVLNPGCKADCMVILEGPQGLGKTKLLEILGGKYYSENTAEFGSKDFYQNLDGSWIIEIAELDTFRKAGANTIKRVISARVDKYRPAFERYVQENKRQCIFVGTTNQGQYLSDSTGARRFWPIECNGDIDIETLKANRDLLFAEAVYLYNQGQNYWEVPEDLAREIQESKEDTDPWEEVILDWLKIDSKVQFTTQNVMSDCLRIDVDKQNKNQKNRVSSILRKFNFKNKPVWIDENGTKKQKKFWVSDSLIHL